MVRRINSSCQRFRMCFVQCAMIRMLFFRFETLFYFFWIPHWNGVCRRYWLLCALLNEKNGMVYWSVALRQRFLWSSAWIGGCKQISLTNSFISVRFVHLLLSCRSGSERKLTLYFFLIANIFFTALFVWLSSFLLCSIFCFPLSDCNFYWPADHTIALVVKMCNPTRYEHWPLVSDVIVGIYNIQIWSV